MDIRQILVVRKDLNMRRGKLVAQAGHAVLKSFFDQGEFKPDERGGGIFSVALSPDVYKWASQNFKKICVSVNNEEELLDILAKAKSYNLPCALIQDNGLTEFKGKPTYTFVSIGPAQKEQLDPVTGSLPLY